MINLLPPRERKENNLRRQKRMVLTSGLILLIFLVALILILYSTKIYIQSQAEYQESLLKVQKEKEETTKISSIEEDFNKYNTRIARINAFYENQDPVSGILKEISEILPSGLYLNSFSYREMKPRGEKEYQIQVSVSGFSPTREKLHRLATERMEEKKEWEEIYFPPSNWVQGEKNIDFNFSFEVKK